MQITKFIILLTLLLPFQLQAQNDLPDLEFSLIAPITNPEGERVLSMVKYPRFHVQVLNMSAEKQYLWKDWTSWGMGNLVLEVKTADSSFYVRRQPIDGKIEGDFPDFWVIESGDYLILEIDMRSPEWKGFPDLYGERKEATIRGIYQCEEDVLAEEFGIWTGRALTNELEVVFE